MGHTFNCDIGAAVIGARYSRARHQAHIVHLIQLRNHISSPIRGWFAADLIPLRYSGGRPCGNLHPQGSRPILFAPIDRRPIIPQDPATDHQNIAMGVGAFIRILIRFFTQRPQTCGAGE